MSMNFSAIKGIVFDFDGVFTDNMVIVSQDGTESVICSRSDGLGLSKLRVLGIPCTVISTETNPVVSRRCEKMRIPARQGIDDKAGAVVEWAASQGLGLESVAYLGNDINDLAALSIVGFPCAVADAYPEVVDIVRFVTERPGGKGAVRELCDKVSAAHVEASAAISTTRPTQTQDTAPR
jgi:YrbI family 3-deoxy-D-manno-octulosonate 8-phosphate phosphatase